MNERIDEQLLEQASSAVKVVDDLGLTGDDRAIVLKAVLDAGLATLSSAAMTSSKPAASNGQSLQAWASDVANPATPSNPIEKISAALGLGSDIVELVFAEEDGEPILVVSSKRLPENKARATRQLAQLICTARQVCGLEEWTTVGTIRGVVADFGRLDSSNFANHLQQMDSVAVLRGSKQKRELKITRPGLESTAELIKELAEPK